MDQSLPCKENHISVPKETYILRNHRVHHRFYKSTLSVYTENQIKASHTSHLTS